MKDVRPTARYKKDLRRVRKRGNNLDKLKIVIAALAMELPLPPAWKDHELSGDWEGIRDIHVEPDWILLYESTEDEIVLIRTGTHADLF